MTERDLAGLRPAELNAFERAQRRDLLASDPEAAADAALADELGELLGGERIEGGPTLEQILDPPRANPRWTWGAVALLAAGVLLWIGLPGASTVRDRGVGAVPVGVQLSAIAEGPDGIRDLAPGAKVRPDERVVFWVDTSAGGSLTLVEDGVQVVYPRGGEGWKALAGSQALGGSAPLAYRPDRAGPHRYEVELCDPDGVCASHGFALEWLAP